MQYYYYQNAFVKFIKYFKYQIKLLNDETLTQEIRVLEKLSKYKLVNIKEDKESEEESESVNDCDSSQSVKNNVFK